MAGCAVLCESIEGTSGDGAIERARREAERGFDEVAGLYVTLPTKLLVFLRHAERIQVAESLG